MPAPTTVRPNRAQDLADTLDRLLAQAGGIGYEAHDAQADGPLFAKLYVRSDDGAQFAVTIERFGDGGRADGS